MATFMGEEMSSRYSQEVIDLTQWFVEKLPIDPIVLSQADYKAGVDALKNPHQQLVKDAFERWLTERKYELSYNQTCQAFFAAANKLRRVTFTDAEAST